MKGDFPTQVGNLVLLDHLDFRKFFNDSVTNVLISREPFNIPTNSLNDFSGDYDVIGYSASKTLSGTLPTELGLLTSWKYIILRECL